MLCRARRCIATGPVAGRCGLMACGVTKPMQHSTHIDSPTGCSPSGCLSGNHRAAIVSLHKLSCFSGGSDVCFL